MFGSTILDVGIGLIVVYLVASLGVTAANEFIATVLSARAKTLRDGLTRLLTTGDVPTTTTFLGRLRRLVPSALAPGPPAAPPASPATALVGKFYAHPLVKTLTRDGRHPSYIPSRTFVLAMLDSAGGTSALAQRSVEQLVQSAASYPGLQRVLTIFAAEVHGDMDALLDRMDRWFDDTMDRVAGWYKRRTQFVSLTLALLLAVGLNMDTFKIANVLWKSGPLRDAVAAVGKGLQERNATTASQAPTSGAPSQSTSQPREDVTADFEALITAGLPIGWRGCDAWLKALPRAWPGWLVSALAISLGAPFWFDVLNRFMEIRGAGKAPREFPKPPELKERLTHGSGPVSGPQPTGGAIGGTPATGGASGGPSGGGPSPPVAPTAVRP